METNIKNTLNTVVQILNETPITGAKHMLNIAGCIKLLEDISQHLDKCEIIHKNEVE